MCSYFYFPLQCSVSPHTHVSICLECVMHFSNVSSETSLVFFPFLYEGGSSSGCKPPSSTLCQPAALGFSPAEPTMSSQHSHPSFGNIHSMADQQQVPETCFLAIKFYDITHVQSIIVIVWLDINSRSYENMFCPHHILFKNCS